MFSRSWFPVSYFPPSYFPELGGELVTGGNGSFVGILDRMARVVIFEAMNRSVLDGQNSMQRQQERVEAQRIFRKMEEIHLKKLQEWAAYTVTLSEL